MAYKLAIFDFDGTLADTFPWIINIFSHLARENDYEKLPTPNWKNVKSGSKETHP